MKQIILLTLTSIAAFQISAQEVKEHYTISGTTQDSVIIIKSALDFINLEQFRLIDEDRIIVFSNSNAKVTLLSANYLKSNYNKNIRPNNLLKLTSNVYFKLNKGQITVIETKLK